MSNPSPDALAFLRQLFADPDALSKIQSALVSAPAIPGSSDLPTASLPQMATTPASEPAPETPVETPSTELIGVLNPDPVSFIEPSGKDGATAEQSIDSPISAQATKSGTTKETKKRRRPEIPKIKAKPTRRSNRGHLRKLKPDSTVHVIEDDAPTEPPPPKQAKRGVSAQRRLVDPSTTADEESSSPIPEVQEVPIVEEKEASSPSKSLDELLDEVQAEVAAETTPQEQSPSVDDVPLCDVLLDLKRKAIREGKQVADVTPTVASTEQADTESEQEEDVALELEGSDMEVDKALTPLFYTADAAKVWKDLQNSLVYGERNIDEVSFNAYNLVDFFKDRGLFDSVAGLMPYNKKVVQMVYSNTTMNFGDPQNRKYGKLFYKNRVYSLTPAIINEMLATPNVKGTVVKDMDKVAKVITGGKMKKWVTPMKSSNLTFLYSALFKIMTMNWIVTSNTTIITMQHGILLYCIGEGLPFNLGQVIFDQIAAKSQLVALPFPSLIYRTLKHQGLKDRASEDTLEPIQVYALNSMLFSGGKVADLPWINPNATATAAPDVTSAATVTIPVSLLQSYLKRLDLMEIQCRNSYTLTTSSIAELKQEFLTLLSSQKGGEDADEAGDVEGTGDAAGGLE